MRLDVHQNFFVGEKKQRMILIVIHPLARYGARHPVDILFQYPIEKPEVGQNERQRTGDELVSSGDGSACRKMISYLVSSADDSGVRVSSPHFSLPEKMELRVHSP